MLLLAFFVFGVFGDDNPKVIKGTPFLVPPIYGSGSIDAVAVDQYGSVFAAGYQNHSWTIGELYHVRDDGRSCDPFFPVEIEYDQVQEAPPVIAGARFLKDNRVVFTGQWV